MSVNRHSDHGVAPMGLQPSLLLSQGLFQGTERQTAAPLRPPQDLVCKWGAQSFARLSLWHFALKQGQLVDLARAELKVTYLR